jgi:hypothetical protein
MPANTSIVITDLDFDSIKNNLKTFLRSQSRFQDFDFEGSGMNVLMDILALNTHYNAFYLNMVGNEMFLDTSKLRQSTISHAKVINYVPESMHGAEARINLIVTPSINEDQGTSVLTLDKYTRFLGTDIDGINYPFVAINSNTTSKVSSSFTFANVMLRQGEVITRQFLMASNNSKRKFEIPSSNVDTTTLLVTVQESSSNTMTTVYVQAEDLTEITANSAVYFVEENENEYYSFYFGDDVIGKKPKIGNIINITYLDTFGEIGNKINVFSVAESVGSYNDNVSVRSWGASYSGSQKETIDQIKYRAPYFYTAQNRAVTDRDYETLIIKDYPNIDSVAVWGGENNDPPIYGKIFLSLKTKENYFLSNLEKENIKEELIRTRNVLTVIPEIVDSVYTYILIRGTVNYNPDLTAASTGTILSFIRAAIGDYRTDYLNKFASTFQKAKLQQYIEESEPAIVSSDIRIFLQKRVELTLNQTKDYTFNFDVPIRKADKNQTISSYPAVTITDGNLNQRNVFFEEVPSINSGISSFNIINGGINYTEAPTVTITGDGSGATAIARISGGRIASIDITNKGTNYNRAFITLTGNVGSGAQIEPVLETRIGTLRTYYLLDDGRKIIVNSNVGTINYDTGTIVLKSLTPLALTTNDYYDTNVLAFNVPVETQIISTLRNRIIDIDEDDPLAIQLDVYAQSL